MLHVNSQYCRTRSCFPHIQQVEHSSAFLIVESRYSAHFHSTPSAALQPEAAYRCNIHTPRPPREKNTSKWKLLRCLLPDLAQKTSMSVLLRAVGSAALTDTCEWEGESGGGERRGQSATEVNPVTHSGCGSSRPAAGAGGKIKWSTGAARSQSEWAQRGAAQGKFSPRGVSGEKGRKPIGFFFLPPAK